MSDLNLGKIIDGHAAREVEYRAIVGFIGYRVGSDGSVWSAWKWTARPKKNVFLSDRWRQLKPMPTRQGKIRVALYRDSKAYYFFIHRLVLLAFVGPCPEGMEACHNDGDGTNNTISNLRWDTHIRNEWDKATHGTVPKGERCGSAKLTEAEVIEIRRLHADGCWTHSKLAAKFKVYDSTIERIVHYKNWKHLITEEVREHE